MEPREVLQQLLVTEKSTIARETGRYTFRVDRRANKNQIKAAVEKLFNVHVDTVRTIIMAGKIKRMGRFEGKSPIWKKAIVKLQGDERITEFENL